MKTDNEEGPGFFHGLVTGAAISALIWIALADLVVRVWP